MSKRANMQARRRQIRRALNRAEDTIQRIGIAKVNRISYGCGLSQSDVRGELKSRRLEKNVDYETIY
jgi:hypothetical protein